MLIKLNIYKMKIISLADQLPVMPSKFSYVEEVLVNEKNIAYTLEVFNLKKFLFLKINSGNKII